MIVLLQYNNRKILNIYPPLSAATWKRRRGCVELHGRAYGLLLDSIKRRPLKGVRFSLSKNAFLRLRVKGVFWSMAIKKIFLRFFV